MDSRNILNYFLNPDRFGDDIELLKKNIDFIVKPPLKRLISQDIIRGYPNIPPQPSREIIRYEELSRFGLKNPYSYIYIDEVVSMMPRELYDKLMLDGWVDEHDYFEENLQKLWRRYLDRERNFYPEDHIKRTILLCIPSNKQFKAVYGDWGGWVWRPRTLNGQETPNEDGWIEDIIRIVDILNGEGIRCIVFYDDAISDVNRRTLYDSIDTHGNKLIEIDIEPDLAKIGYTRDQSITFMDTPIICNMALPIRRGEEKVIIDVYHIIGNKPIFRPRWAPFEGYLELSKVEGGNFFPIETDKGKWILTGVGVRGTNEAGLHYIRELLPSDVKLIGIPLSGYIRRWSETGAVHLDTVLTYLGELNGCYHALIDPMRLGFYSAFEYSSNGIKIVSIPELFKEMGVYIDEIPHEKASRITMANALNLGKGKILVDRYNHIVNDYIRREYGVDVIEVDIPHIEAGGGGVRCATRELWGIQNI